MISIRRDFLKALGRAESLGAELARRFERPIALGIREGLVEVDVVEINPTPRIVESPAAKPITRARAASEPRAERGSWGPRERAGRGVRRGEAPRAKAHQASERSE